MRLPFLRPKSDAGGGADRPERGVDDPGALRVARTQARRRLIGAVVLLLAAVVGFPLLFETQPRPLPGSVAIDGSGLATQADPARRAGGAEATAARSATPAGPAVSAARATVVAGAGRLATGTAATALAASSVAASPASAAAAAPAAVPAAASAAEAPAPAASLAGKAVVARKTDTPASAPMAAPARPAKAEAEAAAEGAAAASAPTPAPNVRWVVQVGAYNDMERMREARQKAEKLGFKTYITDVDSPTGKRTRVRLGPFATKKEADAAAVKVKANGMAANVLSV